MYHRLLSPHSYCHSRLPRHSLIALSPSSVSLLMSRLTFGLTAGILYGMASVATMLPMAFPDKRAALLGAFLNRFAIGLLIPVVVLPAPRWAIGLGLGVLLSLPDAIITKAFVPIVGLGAVGGLVIGWLAGRYPGLS